MKGWRLVLRSIHATRTPWWDWYPEAVQTTSRSYIFHTLQLSIVNPQCMWPKIRLHAIPNAADETCYSHIHLPRGVDYNPYTKIFATTFTGDDVATHFSYTNAAGYTYCVDIEGIQQWRYSSRLSLLCHCLWKYDEYKWKLACRYRCCASAYLQLCGCTRMKTGTPNKH